MKRAKSVTLPLTVATTLFSTGFTQAVFSAEATPDRQIEEVMVTAERREASIQDTSISITAFTSEFLDEFGIRNQEDLQNFIPATTIQPYDSTIRGVGRNFRALGGDPGVATYMNGVYSEDLLTATAATFWDVERIEVLRGPQGTLYGRNAVGGAMNILYKEPTNELDYGFKSIIGNFGTQEYYGMISGPLVDDVLTARLNFSVRDRDGVVKDIGPQGGGLDGLGTENTAVLFKWTPTDSLTFDLRMNQMRIDRPFGGADGAGLVVLNEDGEPTRNTTDLVPGYRRIDTTNTAIANFEQSNFYDASRPILNFTDPATGAMVQAQRNRPGIDVIANDGFQNAAASIDGFNNTSAASAAIYNACVFDSDVDGDDVCAATNGLNREQFDQDGTQFTATFELSESVTVKYIYGHNELSYYRTTDDDNTGSLFHDRQFYVNHEATYESHELQAFYELTDSLSFTSGIFSYDATIDQRGDFYSSLGEGKFANAYTDNTGLDELSFFGNNRPMATLHSARTVCRTAATPAASCAVNYAVQNPTRANNNLYISSWQGDNGTLSDLDVSHGPNTVATDLLYHTQTKREAYAAYTQAVWDINDVFTLTMGIRYASDEVTAEENLFRYTEGGGAAFAGGAFGLSLATYNKINGGLVADTAAPGGFRATPTVVNGGVPIAISVYRPFNRKDTKVTGRVNLDWNVTDNTLMYLSATSGYRSGGYNLVFFSRSPTYEPEELVAYELGYKSQMRNNTIQLNGSIYYYDYENIHTVATEVAPGLLPGSPASAVTTSTLAAPGAEIYGVEAELIWLASDRTTLGGNFSFTPSEYTEDLFLSDPSNVSRPSSLFPSFEGLVTNIKGNQLLQVPDLKYTAWAGYRIPLSSGSIDLFGVYSWIDEVYFSSFQSEYEKAPSYGRTDVRATWTSGSGKWVVSGFVNNIFDEVGKLQILNNGQAEFFRQTAATTLPRLYGMEFTYSLNN
ncbi:MAG: TonB-dependent receptor [Proteobacteria bacterium]|nr:TonB-dependent receptor [Pseudomonadota bacterium]